MRTIEIFSLGEHLFEDQTVRKYGTILVANGIKNGFKKINPVILWIDAGLSVIEAGNSYFNYAKEREITKQLRIENELIKKELEIQLTLLEVKNIRDLEKGNVRIEKLSYQLKIVSVKNWVLIKSINSNLSVAKRMLNIVKDEREQTANFEKLQILQVELDKFIRASLMYLMYAADDTGKEEE